MQLFKGALHRTGYSFEGLAVKELSCRGKWKLITSIMPLCILYTKKEIAEREM
jgi:hypothetical protein